MNIIPNQNENFETASAYIIHKANLSRNAFDNLRSKMSILEYKTEEEIPKAFFVEDDYVFIPKIPMGVLEFIAGKKLMFTKIIPEHEYVEKEYELKWNPLPHQVDLIKDGTKHLMSNTDKRLCICLAPGLGKTFCTSAIIEKLQCKFLFLVYSSKIVDQSIEAIGEHIGTAGLYRLKNSSDFLELNNDKIQGLFMTHSMFKQLVKIYGIQKVNEILFDKIGINLKVLDEFDREVSSMYFMDSMMNFRYGIYLTGTKFKSLKPDDRLFQLVFRSVKTVGLDIKLPPNKDALFVHYNFRPSPLEYTKIMRDEGTFKTFYNNYIAQKDILLDYIMQKFYYDETEDSEKNSKKLFKKMLSEDGQIQFFVSRIENCEIVRDKLISNFGISPEDIGIVNSSLNDKQKAKNINKPWLVTTSQSLGRGVDSSLVRVLVLLEFHFSSSELMQQNSRIGRVGKKFGYLIVPVDHSFSKVMMSYNSKVKDGIYRDGFRNNFHFQVPSELEDEYINGYRKDSLKAKEILDAKAKKEKNQKVSKDIDRAFSHWK
ncbi:MAG: DEAD/DEAH box helicase [Paraclostridium sp.]